MAHTSIYVDMFCQAPILRLLFWALENQQLAGGQVVVCKIQQAALLVTTLLPLTIAFHLPKVVLALLLPIARVSLTPLVRTLPADLPVK